MADYASGIYRKRTLGGDSQAACGVRSRRRRDSKYAAECRQRAQDSDDPGLGCSADCLRERRQSDAGAGRGPARRNCRARGSGRRPAARHAPDCHREHSAELHRRPGWVDCRLWRSAPDPGPRIFRSKGLAHQLQPVAAGAGLRFRCVAAGGPAFRPGAGGDLIPRTAGRRTARREPRRRLRARPLPAAAEIAGRAAGRSLTGAAGCGHARNPFADQPRTAGPRNRHGESLCLRNGPVRRRLHSRPAACALPPDRGSLFHAARCGERRVCPLSTGLHQLERLRGSAGTFHARAEGQLRLRVEPRQHESSRLYRHPHRARPRIQRPGYNRFSFGCNRE